MLSARGVRKTYPGGVTALAGVDLEVAAGETVALVGESGSGKSTLLRLFNRTVEPDAGGPGGSDRRGSDRRDSDRHDPDHRDPGRRDRDLPPGEVRVAGELVAQVDPVALRRRIGYVQQEGGLIPHWRVERNVELVPRLLGWPKERRRRRAREVLELVGLDPDAVAERYPRQLSGGQRQRVAFARALAAEPEVVLLDEPFGALDALTRLELQREFLHLKAVLGRTLLLVTHDLAEAFRLADRVAVMRDGRILQTAAPAELAARPADPYVEALLALREVG